MLPVFYLTNSFSKQKEAVVCEKNRTLKMYVCGITPYDEPHIGHGRVYVFFDIVYRLLQLHGCTVQYCRNFTDIDDKLLHKAEKLYGDQYQFSQIAQKYMHIFHEAMGKLNCLPPDFEPTVTDHISHIITFVQKLIDRSHAYIVDGDVYFSIESFPSYGQLSHQKIDELYKAARVEENTKKKNQLDFALWKNAPEGGFWESPWGNGRPGWHIECSALAYHYLGEHIDIHGGGIDLLFPHHENERAQTESATGKEFVRHWVHNAFVCINKEKMSKSLNNFYTLNQVFETYDPMIIRFYYALHHYRNPLDFSFADIDATAKSYNSLVQLLGGIALKKYRLEELDHPIVQRMLTFLYDDINVPGCVGVIFEQEKVLQQDQELLSQVAFICKSILGLTLEKIKIKEVVVTPEIQALLDEREAARTVKDWKKADAIREQLAQLGFNVQDKKFIK